ncbi:unnamed protein product, partial [Scytosiphon promiscuus]
ETPPSFVRTPNPVSSSSSTSSSYAAWSARGGAPGPRGFGRVLAAGTAVASGLGGLGGGGGGGADAAQGKEEAELQHQLEKKGRLHRDEKEEVGGEGEGGEGPGSSDDGVGGRSPGGVGGPVEDVAEAGGRRGLEQQGRSGAGGDIPDHEGVAAVRSGASGGSGGSDRGREGRGR